MLDPRPHRRREGRGESWCLVEEQACKRSERHPVKMGGRAQYWGEHQVKWVEVDEGEAEHPVKTVGYARQQGERPVKVVGHARAGAQRRPTTNEGAQRRPTASEGGRRRSMAKAEHPVKAAVRV